MYAFNTKLLLCTYIEIQQHINNLRTDECEVSRTEFSRTAGHHEKLAGQQDSRTAGHREKLAGQPDSRTTREGSRSAGEPKSRTTWEVSHKCVKLGKHMYR